MRTPIIVVLAAVLPLAAVVAPAGAKAPEENGQIVFARFDPLLEETTAQSLTAPISVVACWPSMIRSNSRTLGSPADSGGVVAPSQ